ncbi:MAG: 50S ribosomal protein L29 [Candidatus Aenigmatarchaeota archaeon]
MAIARIDELREMDKSGLEEKKEELKLEIAKERAQIEIGGVPENPGKIKAMKKTIARINTILNER